MHIKVAPERVAGRVARLRQETRAAHEHLDVRIMASEPFRDRSRFGRFVTIQYYFHRDIEPVYASEAIRSILPDLQQRRRLELIEQDLHDLEIPVPPGSLTKAEFAVPLDMPTALGWLYVSEGSTLGAAILSKEAAKLGLSDSFGARHFAAHPEGRGLSWQRFTATLDALQLSEKEEARVIEGANHAFRRVQNLAKTLFV